MIIVSLVSWNSVSKTILFLLLITLESKKHKKVDEPHFQNLKWLRPPNSLIQVFSCFRSAFARVFKSSNKIILEIRNRPEQNGCC